MEPNKTHSSCGGTARNGEFQQQLPIKKRRIFASTLRGSTVQHTGFHHPEMGIQNNYA